MREPGVPLTLCGRGWVPHSEVSEEPLQWWVLMLGLPWLTQPGPGWASAEEAGVVKVSGC